MFNTGEKVGLQEMCFSLLFHWVAAWPIFLGWFTFRWPGIKSVKRCYSIKSWHMQSWARRLPFCFLWLLSVPHLSWRLPRSFKSCKRGNEAWQSLTLTLWHVFVKATFICFWKAVEFGKQCTIHRKMIFITLKYSRGTEVLCLVLYA